MVSPLDKIVSSGLDADGKATGKIIDRLTPSQKSELREAFDLFDKDGDETISCNEFKSLFLCFGMRVTQEEVEALVLQYDADESGEIDFEEFCEMMAGYILQPDYDPEIVEAYKVFNRN